MTEDTMNSKKIAHLIEQLKSCEIEFTQGLTDQEVDAVETLFDFTFLPDLRLFLQTQMPVSDKFVDWRKTLSDDNYRLKIEEKMQLPLEGMLFDIETSGFWLGRWGKKPKDLEKQKAIARQAVAKAPTLIPIYSHRYIPARPSQAGNPIFSVHQTDIVIYGKNLINYFDNEFGLNPAKKIEFWTDIVDLNEYL